MGDKVDILESFVDELNDEVEELKTGQSNMRGRLERLEERESEREYARDEYIRGLSEQKFEILNQLRHLDETDRTQSDLAEEHGVDRSYISKLKTEFKERGVL